MKLAKPTSRGESAGRIVTTVLAAAAVITVLNAADAQSRRVQVGTLTCSLSVGLDVGLTAGSVIIWTVLANTNRYKGMLTGTYTGASAEMSVVAGLGANVLVGGLNRTVALQPLSVQGQFGLDIAAGVGTLDLHPSS